MAAPGPIPPRIGATEVAGNTEIRHLREGGKDGKVRIRVEKPASPGAARVVVTLKQAAPLLDVLIWDAAGRHVRTLYYGPGERGGNLFLWDGKSHAGDRMPRGSYILRASLGRDVHHLKFFWTE